MSTNPNDHSTATTPNGNVGCDPGFGGAAVFIGHVAAPVPPTAKVHGLQVDVRAEVAPVAFAPGNGTVGMGATLHLGPPLDSGTVVIAAPTPAAIAIFLVRSLLAVAAAAPSAIPAGPAPKLLEEARAIVAEDLLRTLGVPIDGPDREISEVAVHDVRSARRSAELLRRLLDQSIDEHPSLVSLLAEAVA